MRKYFLVLSGIILSGAMFSSQVFASETYIIISYDYGNQIVRSGLTVLSNGLVMRQNSQYGKATPVFDEQMNGQDLVELQDNIEKANLETSVVKEGEPTSMGSMSGTLMARTKEGYNSPIIVVSRSDSNSPGARDSVQYLPGAAARKIIDFVNGLVDHRIPVPTSAREALPASGNQVAFHIVKGTKNGAWNTQATEVHVKVGDSLRIFNDDTVAHRLHTNGDPCNHGPIIPVGSSWECLIERPFDPAKSGPLYDHNYGAKAAFWVKAEK